MHPDVLFLMHICKQGTEFDSIFQKKRGGFPLVAPFRCVIDLWMLHPGGGGGFDAGTSVAAVS
jgi:hypothetical protein